MSNDNIPVKTVVNGLTFTNLTQSQVDFACRTSKSTADRIAAEQREDPQIYWGTDLYSLICLLDS